MLTNTEHDATANARPYALSGDHEREAECQFVKETLSVSRQSSQEAESQDDTGMGLLRICMRRNVRQQAMTPDIEACSKSNSGTHP